MLRERETVYRSALPDLDDEFPDVLLAGNEIVPAKATALGRCLQRIRDASEVDDDGGPGSSSDFGSAIG